jgi:hypothetical protein
MSTPLLFATTQLHVDATFWHEVEQRKLHTWKLNTPTVDLAATSLSLPVVGGPEGWEKAFIDPDQGEGEANDGKPNEKEETDADTPTEKKEKTGTEKNGDFDPDQVAEEDE